MFLDICDFRLCCYRHPPSFPIIGAHNPEELCHKRNVAHDEGGGSYVKYGFLLLAGHIKTDTDAKGQKAELQ